ncbi:MAG: DUF2288 domain-containing protein [Prochloraceae cyanobacterium]|nr:DUF2288 domain-containing protein [Prochloraceae cyanobacterium]
MQDIKSQLAEELADIEWSDLVPHAQRDALIVVNESLNLVDVGVAIASDRVNIVQHWIAEGLIQKPSSEQLGAWNVEPNKKFSALIVQPFVLVAQV